MKPRVTGSKGNASLREVSEGTSHVDGAVLQTTNTVIPGVLWKHSVVGCRILWYRW